MYLLLKRLSVEEDGQGLVEYTFVVLLAALVFWMGVRDTNVGTTLTSLWVKISDCVNAPFSCTA
jgi:Flp pilus assembly pilin Flp